jgi:hypothetical protein
MDLSTLVAMIPGPWGIVAGVAITIATQFVRARLAQPATPVATPTSPAIAPVTLPVSPGSTTPVLDGLFAFLKAKFGAAPASAPQDLTHESAADLLGKLFGTGLPPTK